MDLNIFFLILVPVNMAVISLAMYYTFARLEARGAKYLFLFFFGLLGFITMYFCSLLVRDPNAKEFMMIAAYGFIYLLPLIWSLMVYEFSGWDTKEAWHFILPFAVINAVAYSLFFFELPGMNPLMEYHACTLIGPMFNCQVEFSTLYYAILICIALEFFGGIGWLLYSFFAQKHYEERNRYLFLVIAVSFGVLSVWIAGVAIPDGPNSFDPLPIGLSIATGLLLMATYNKRLFNIQLGVFGQNQMVDDLLLVVNNDHYIQDANMTTLQTFGIDVQNVVNTQVETVFFNYPEIVKIFAMESVSTELMEIKIEGETRFYEPTLATVFDPETSLPTGMSLQLRDVTGQHSVENSPQKAVGIVRDPLTNQYNRESFFQFGSKLLSHTRDRDQQTAIVVVDIDDFHSVNQRFSHLVGDQGLIQLVTIINTIIRSTDLQARFKADEMVLLLPNADEFSTYQICTRIKDTVASHRFSFQSQEFQMTVSLGYTIAESDAEHDLEQIVSVAYQALEQSHSLGRSRLTYLPLGAE